MCCELPGIEVAPGSGSVWERPCETTEFQEPPELDDIMALRYEPPLSTSFWWHAEDFSCGVDLHGNIQWETAE